MPQSAVSSRRSDRKEATASRLTSVSRRLTAEHGLSGFTIEQLCDEVGVSRRTFFNYFPSKDDVVVGLDEIEETARFRAEFTARSSRGWPAVVDDLVELAVDHARTAGFGIDEHADLIAAIEREPRLAARFIGVSRERERMLVALVAERENTTADDARARAVIQAVAGILRLAGERILDRRSDVDFETAITDAHAAMRDVLASSIPGRDRS